MRLAANMVLVMMNGGLLAISVRIDATTVVDSRIQRFRFARMCARDARNTTLYVQSSSAALYTTRHAWRIVVVNRETFAPPRSALSTLVSP
jgi:hypothetical protein